MKIASKLLLLISSLYFALSYGTEIFGNDMFKYKNKKRLILVKSNKPYLLAQQEQVAMENDKGFSERKLMVLTINPKNRLIINHSDKDVFLVGLDGQIKEARDDIFEPKTLFTTIDSMPMRKFELQNQSE